MLDACTLPQVLLAMRPDLNSYHFQGGHFRGGGLTPGQRYGFSLLNADESACSRARD